MFAESASVVDTLHLIGAQKTELRLQPFDAVGPTINMGMRIHLVLK